MNPVILDPRSAPATDAAAGAVRAAVAIVGGLAPAPGSVVLDVGIDGPDAALALARTFDVEVIAIDRDPERVRDARRRAAGERRVSFFVEDPADLPFRRGAFDLVLSADGAPGPDTARARAEMERVLKPGGRLVFAGARPHAA